MSRRWYSAGIISGLIGFLVLLVIYWRYGFLYLDGGYYVSSAHGVAKGQLPYRDFFFPQGPVYPYVYGFIQLFFGSTVGIARMTSLVLACATCLITVAIALRRSGIVAALLVVALFSFNSFIAFHLVVEKLNVLSAFFVILSAFWLLRDETRRSLLYSLLAMVVATGTRYTILPALLLLIVWLFIRERHQIGRFITLMIPVVLVGLVLTVPFLLLCPEQFLYGIIGVHVSAESGSTYHFGLLGKLGALSDLFRSATLLIILTIPVLISLLYRGYRKLVVADSREGVLWGIIALVSLTNMSANWFHSSYQIVIIPLWILLTSLGVSRLLSLDAVKRFRTAILLTICLGSLMTVISQGRTFIWMGDRGIASPFLEDVSRKIATYSKPGDRILSDQPLIVYQAGRQTVHGFEGAPFTYTPTWSNEKCHRFSTVNDDLLSDILLSRNIALLALTRESFRMASPGFVIQSDEAYDRVWRMIRSAWEPVDAIPHFAGTTETLYLYAPRSGIITR